MPMRPAELQVSCFDELYLDSLVHNGLINQKQKRMLIFGALQSKWENEVLTAKDWLEICRELKPRAIETLTEAKTRVFTTKLRHVSSSNDNRTKKLLIDLQSGAQIETCIILKGTTRVRATVCVSSQVGCRMGCTFCATGTLGLTGNLSSGEIMEQYAWCYRLINSEKLVQGIRPIRNIVFMGMGEPLDNYDNVMGAVRQLIEVHSLAGYQITVSTVGFSVGAIKKLSVDAPTVSLALSLHAATPESRRLLVPSSANVNLKQLLKTCLEFVENQSTLSRTKGKRQKLLVEYCLIKNVNDGVDDAHQLGELLKSDRPDSFIINVIPYNPTLVDAQYEPPEPASIEQFVNILRSDYSLRVYLRQECGQDVSAACGQLALVRQRHHHRLVNVNLMLAIGICASLVILGIGQVCKKYRLQRQSSKLLDH